MSPWLGHYRGRLKKTVMPPLQKAQGVQAQSLAARGRQCGADGKTRKR